MTSSCQRSTNHSRICAGSTARSVHSRACVANSPWGSRTKTQRRGTGGLPERYQTAVCEVSSTVRVVPLYQATAAVVQDRPGWSTSNFSAVSRRPFSGGRPFRPG